MPESKTELERQAHDCGRDKGDEEPASGANAL
jgi:hypothetical protein